MSLSNEDILKFAKIVSEGNNTLSNLSMWDRVRAAGFTGEPRTFTKELARTLLAVWDGKASTLDQAAAWREVHAYLKDTGVLVGDNGRSELKKVIDFLGDARRVMVGARPLSPVDGTLLTVEELEKMIYAGKFDPKPQPVQVDTHIGAAIGEPSDLDKLLKSVVIRCRAHRPGVRFAAAVSFDKQKIDTPEVEGHPLPDGVAMDLDGLLAMLPGTVKILREMQQEKEYPGTLPTEANADDSIKWLGREFREDDTVYLKSGGPAMQVCDVINFRDGLKYECVWFSNAEEHVAWFQSTSLSRTPFEQPANDNNQPQFCSETVSTDFQAAERFSAALSTLAKHVEPARLDVVRRLLVLQDTCYGLAEQAGWWKDLSDPARPDVRTWPKHHLDNWISAKLMLIVTEVAEAMEGHRKGIMDDKLQHRGMLEVELADAVIRIMDLAGGLNLDVAGAIVEKLAYNLSREDHKIENRAAAGGKSV